MVINNETTGMNFYSTPEMIDTRIFDDRIEVMYIETSTLQLAVYPPPPPERRVFKYVFSCKDGAWHRSERIYGRIQPPLGEQYYF